MYVKIFSTILDSSVWLEDGPTRLVWITMLCMADRKGRVRASFGGLAHRARVSREECRGALRVLESPDPESKDQDYGGRRIEPIEGGWLVLNYHKYRELQTEEQRAEAEKKRRQRAKNRAESSPDTSGTRETRPPHAEAEAEAESSETTSPAAPTPKPTNWHAEAAVVLRESGIVEAEIGDALKNWWAPARRRFTDPEIAAVVRAHGRRFAQKGETWNPARVWNPRNEDFDERFRWAISQQRKVEARSPTKGIKAVREIIGGAA